MAARLKVFTWSDGFHAYTVATTSRGKALAAWGVTRDLFKDGDASELSAGADYDAALSDPGSIVRRGLSVDVGKLEKVATPKAPKKAELDRVAALEREVIALDAEHEAAAATLAEKRDSLNREAAALNRNHDQKLRAVQARLKAARHKLEG
jgi:hypothetical protein